MEFIISPERKEYYSSEPLTVYCLPVSGGGFVSQCGLLGEVYLAKRLANGGRLDGSKTYKPNIVMASSGGNIASYVAMAGDWSPEGIERIACKIESSMFVKPWVPTCLSIIPSWIVGAFNGSVYKPGSGSEYLFQTIFTPETVTATEIWTGTYDHTNKKAQFICNVHRGNSLIKPDYFDDSSQFHGCNRLMYLNGNLSKITSACMASASIPIITKRKEIDGVSYADGGAMYASPLSAMSSELYRLVTGTGPYAMCSPSGWCYSHNDRPISVGKRSLHLIYFCSYDMDTPKDKEPSGSVGSFSSSLSQLIHANALMDRSTAIKLIYQIAGNDSEQVVVEHHPSLNHHSLAKVFQTLQDIRHYVMVIYPHEGQYVPLHGFTSNHIRQGICKTKENYGVYLWYLP